MLWYSTAIYFSLLNPSTSDLINRTTAWTYQVTFTFSYLYFSLFDPSTSDLINRTTAWTYQVTFTLVYSTHGGMINRWPHQKTNTLDDVLARNSTYKKWSKLIDFVMRIELTSVILMTRLWDLLRNSTIHFRMYLYLVTCFVRVTVLFLCRSQARKFRLLH